MYADQLTPAITFCLEETKRRRELQKRFNDEHGITPESIKKAITEVLSSPDEADYVTVPEPMPEVIRDANDLPQLIARLREEMTRAAADLAFERAAEIRDRITVLKEMLLLMGEDTVRETSPPPDGGKPLRRKERRTGHAHAPTQRIMRH